MLLPRDIQWKGRALKTLQCVRVSVCPHLPRSPDLALWSFWLFPQSQNDMKCKHFELIQDIKATVTTQPKTQKRTSRAASNKWQK